MVDTASLDRAVFATTTQSSYATSALGGTMCRDIGTQLEGGTSCINTNAAADATALANRLGEHNCRLFLNRENENVSATGAKYWKSAYA